MTLRSVLCAAALALSGPLSPAQVLFHEDFNDNSAGWTLGIEWQIGGATAYGSPGDCGDLGDPGIDADGTPGGGIAGVIIGGQPFIYGIHGFYWLTSPVVNTAGSTLLALQYHRWLNTMSYPYMFSVVEVYDGSAWATVWDQGFAPVCLVEGSWTSVSHDITAFANANLQVRFGFLVGAFFPFSMSQWNLDNVSIFDPSGACTLGLSAYNGPGSVRVAAHCPSTIVPPGTQLFNCITLNAGSFPFGYWFGIDPNFTQELLPQFVSGGLPFVGYTNGQGDVVWSLPSGVPPGIPAYAVTVAISPAGAIFAASPPVSFVTL
jgi:hypothetical protein